MAPQAPIVTLVKFITNRQENHPLNRLLTRTMGRVGFIASEYYQAHDKDPKSYVLPAHNEYWYVEILSEIGRNMPKGCYLLRPLLKVGTTTRNGTLEPDTVKLIPGTFRAEKDGRTLYIYPPRTASSYVPNYVLDSETKNYVLSKYKIGDRRYSISSFVVVFDRPPSFISPAPLPVQAVPPKPSDTEPLLDLDQLSTLISD